MSHLVSKFHSIEDMLAEENYLRRHNVPISTEEIESMIRYSFSTINFKFADETSYDLNGSQLQFIRMSAGQKDLVRTRLRIRVPNVPPQVLFYCVKDPTTRLSFDKTYRRFELSRKVDDFLDILISEVSAPLGISNREFVEWRRIRLPDIGERRERLIYAVQLRSCSESQCSNEIGPSSHNVQRAETWISGYIFKWWFDENMGILGSEVLVLSQVDPCGRLPRGLVQSSTFLDPRKWVNRLVDCAAKCCATRGICMSKTDRDIEAVLSLRDPN